MSGTDTPTGSHAVTGTTGSTGSTGSSAGSGSGETRSLGEILTEVTTDLSELFKQEVALAKVELKQEAGKAGKGAGMLAGAGVAAVMLLVFLSLALMWLLDDVLPRSASALIVAGLWALVAAALAVVGRTNLRNADPALPQTQQTLKEDARWAKHPTS